MTGVQPWERGRGAHFELVLAQQIFVRRYALIRIFCGDTDMLLNLGLGREEGGVQHLASPAGPPRARAPDKPSLQREAPGSQPSAERGWTPLRAGRSVVPVQYVPVLCGPDSHQLAV